MKYLNQLITLIAASLLFISCNQNETTADRITPANRMDSISYIIGLDYGEGVKGQDIDVNPLMVYKGFSDALNDTSIISDSIKIMMITKFNEEIKTKLERESQKILSENFEKGKAFLEQNQNMEGVQVLPSGLQYKVIKTGAGNYPGPNDSVMIHYRAMFIDRSVFDLSYERGAAGIRLNNVIDGLAEGLQLMKPGGILELYIPPELGYRDQNFANVIPAGSTLIYTVELLEVIK